MMEYQVLGKTDLKISRISFGCMSLDPNDPLSQEILLSALDEGINYFDTADLYNQGQNEALLGRTFKGVRNRVIIATKVGNHWRQDGSGWDWTPSKKYILESVEQSLTRLKTEYIDLYQLHGGTMEDPIDEIIEAFELLKAAGKIRYYGISSIRPKVIREYVKRSSIISVMMQYSLLDRRPEEEMLSFLLMNEIPVLARGAIAKGLLVSKPPQAFLNYSTDQVAEAARAIREIASEKRSAESISLHYVIDNPAIGSAVLGIRTYEQLHMALDALYSSPLTKAEFMKLNSTLPVNHY